MAEYAEALIAVWDGRSRGTLNMIRLAGKCGLRVFVYRVDLEDERLEAKEMQLGLCVGWVRVMFLIAKKNGQEGSEQSVAFLFLPE